MRRLRSVATTPLAAVITCALFLSPKAWSGDIYPVGRVDSLEDISARAARTTAFIAISIDDISRGIKDQTYGSGFLVSDHGLIATSYHSLSDWLELGDDARKRSRIEVSLGSRFALPLEANYVAGRSDIDIALLQIEVSPLPISAAPMCFTADLPMQSFLFAFGYPLSADLTSAPGVYLGGSPSGTWGIGARFPNGMAGGPVYDEKGFVIGMIKGSEPSSMQGYVTPLKLGRELLEAVANVKQACYGTCRSPQNGVERWTKSIPWSKVTDWLGGGHNQVDECAKIREAFSIEHPFQSLVITKTSELSSKDVFGNTTYQYKCEGVINSDPIYNELASPSCPSP
jgi:Trypsin-like peptidase domain